MYKSQGQEHTVVLSSHILSEVRAICEKVLIIAKGKLAAFDAPENLEKLFLASRGISFVAEAEADEVEEILKGIDGISAWQMKGAEDGNVCVDVQIASGEISDLSRSLFFAFAGKQKALLEMTAKKANLEDVFIELTENDMPEAGMEKGESKESEAADQ